jgi:hypothetical protein
MQGAICIASLRSTRSSSVQGLCDLQGNAEKLTESKFEGSLQIIATTRLSHEKCIAQAKTYLLFFFFFDADGQHMSLNTAHQDARYAKLKVLFWPFQLKRQYGNICNMISLFAVEKR